MLYKVKRNKPIYQIIWHIHLEPNVYPNYMCVNKCKAIARGFLVFCWLKHTTKYTNKISFFHADVIYFLFS